MNLKEKLQNGPFLFDGATGTYYAEKFGHDPEFCELACLKYPERIEEIHREYIASGAMAIKTNTFSANERSLDCSFKYVAEIIDAAWNISKKASLGTDAVVFADIGPMPCSKDFDAYGQYIKIIDRFLSLGAENFLFETLSSTEHIVGLSQYIKSQTPNATIICSFAVSPDGFTREGVSVSRLVDEMNKISEVDAFGLNCSCGPTHMSKLISEARGSLFPISAMPNAGYPTMIGNRMYYENNADYFAVCVARFCNNGVSILGGCCGTTPEHIKKLSRLLVRDSRVPNIKVNTEIHNKCDGIVNGLWNKLEAGQRVFAVELDPPSNSDISAFMRGAKALKESGADAITIADCPVSRARADSSLLACKLKRELGIDPIPHMTCRDRNIIATKALLLGLNIEGVNNVLVVTGDPVPMEERSSIKSVFNFNSMVLASFIRDLKAELSNGPFKVFGALNLNAVNFDSQLRHAQDKLRHGVDGFLTQPVHSKRALENLRIARNELDGKILGGVMPIVSYKNACFMNNEIAGISVSDEIIRQYEGLDRDAASRLAVSLSTEIAQSMSEYVDGYYLITPFMRTEIICEIMNNLK